MNSLVPRVINRLVRPMGLRCVANPKVEPVSPIPNESLANSRIVQDRWAGIHLVPKGGVVAEVGVAFGNFSESIINIVQPKKFVAIDTFGLDEPSWSGHNAFAETLQGMSHENYYKKRFDREISEGVVEVNRGYSSIVLEQYENRSFDMIYVDAAHDYESVKKDLAVATQKIKDQGLIILNDYTMMDPLLLQPYGIVQAVHELCEKGEWEIVYLALHRFLFCDVALRRKHLN